MSGDSKNAHTREVLEELMVQLESLKHESDEISKKVRSELEDRWHEQHTEIFPRLCLWKEALSATAFTSFRVVEGCLEFMPLLSDASSPAFVHSLDLSDDAELAILESQFGPGAARLIKLSFGAAEMQLDFDSGLAALPLVLLEGVVGLFFVCMPPPKEADYPKIMRESEALLTALRKSLMCLGSREIRPLLSSRVS